MFLCHATFAARVPSIKKYGLGYKQPKNWKFSTDNVVCFAEDPEEAASFCEAAEETPEDVYESGIVVLAVDPNRLGWRLGGDQNNQGSETYVYKGLIPAELLYIVTSKGEMVGPLSELTDFPLYEE